MNWNEFQIWIAALCAWREARGEGHDGIRCVLHVIANRSATRRKSWAEVVFQKMQFSSMTAPGDPELSLVPVPPDPQFEDCYETAASIFAGNDYDLTQGSTFYFADTIAPPSWAATMTFVIKIGKQSFYKP
jgi:spore germination cell wall hydrolase CwlJ-like protein